jgi:hypothetical protein
VERVKLDRAPVPNDVPSSLFRFNFRISLLKWKLGGNMGCIDVWNIMCRGKSISSKTEGTRLRFHAFGDWQQALSAKAVFGQSVED